MKLFNKTIDRQLFKQYSLGSDLSKQEVVVKIFNPQGRGTWFIINSDPEDPDYLWAIVDLGYGVEVGSVSRSELENYRGRFGLGFERDLSFDPVNAEELFNGLRNGEFYKKGGNLSRDRKFLNHNEQYEVDYSRGKNRKGYGYADGGEVTFTDYNDCEIMYEPHSKKYYANDVEFDTLQQAKDFIDSGEVSAEIRNAYSKGFFADGGEIEVVYERRADFKKKPIKLLLLSRGREQKGFTFSGKDQVAVLENYNRNKQEDLEKLWNLKGYESKYADGGDIENFSDNQRMIMNQNVELEHHHEELEDILEDTIPVPAWVVAKMATATESVSDITHYLDGQKELTEDEKEEEDEDDEIKDKEVVEPIDVSAGTKSELTKKFTDDAWGNLRGFLKGMEGIDLRDDYTFDYKNEQFEVEPIINSDENGVSNAVFTIFDGDGEEQGEVTYSREGGKQKFTANSDLFSWNNAKFEDGGYFDGTIPNVSTYMSTYADGGSLKNEEFKVKDKFKILNHNDIFTIIKVYGGSGDLLVHDQDGYQNVFNPKELKGKIIKIYDYAKGGEIAKAEILGLSKNIMGTTDIEMKITGMRKPQDFIVYPIGKDEAGNVITIQSDTRIGQINLVKGVGVMSQSHSNGAYFVHLQIDKKTPFTLNEKDLADLKEFINKTSGSSVGSRGIVSDNSGASRIFAKGGITYYNNENQHRLSRPKSDMEEVVYEKIKNRIDPDLFIGNFGWKTPMNKTAFGYLYALDDFDKQLVKNVKLKQGEVIFRYVNRITAIGGMMPFIKINIEKVLLYFPVINKVDEDEIVFETRGINPLWLSLIEGSFAKGGFMNDVYADGGQVRVGDRFKYDWTDGRIGGVRGYDVVEVIKNNVTSSRDFKTKVMVLKTIESSEPSHVGRIEEEYKPNFKKAILRGMIKPLKIRVQSLPDDYFADGGGVSNIESIYDEYYVRGYENKAYQFAYVPDFSGKQTVVAYSLGLEDGAKRKKKDFDAFEKYMKEIFSKNKGDKKYILKADIESVTVKRNGKEVTYKSSDVYNGANLLSNGGDLQSKANYVPKRDVVSVQLKNGETVKPVNGYWVKKGAEPINNEPTPTNLQPEISETEIRKDSRGNWRAETTVDNFNGYDWRISTVKTYSGNLVSSAQGGKTEPTGTRGYSIFKYTMYQDPNHTLEVSKPKRLTDKVVSEQHDKALVKFKEFMETGVFKGGGKISNFDKLSAKVAKEYEGKPVKNQYQEEYGKYYSHEEAQEVGDKVAGKMKAMTADKKAFGGLFDGVKSKLTPKTYANLDDKMVFTKDGRAVQVIDQSGDTLFVIDANSIGTGVLPRKMNILEIDPTSYEMGGATFAEKSKAIAKKFVGKKVEPKYQKKYGKTYSSKEAKEVGNKIAGSMVKKSNGGTEILKQANDLAKKICKDGESWLDAKKRAFAQLKK